MALCSTKLSKGQALLSMPAGSNSLMKVKTVKTIYCLMLLSYLLHILHECIIFIYVLNCSIYMSNNMLSYYNLSANIFGFGKILFPKVRV